MRVLVIYRINLDEYSVSGIRSKMLGQVAAFRKYHKTDYIYLSDIGICINDELIHKLPDNWGSTIFSKYWILYHVFYQTLKKRFII